MKGVRSIEFGVGIFLLLAGFSFFVLTIKVSGLTRFFEPPRYHVFAEFDEIGQLKVRAPIKMSGVTIGEVSNIRLDPKNYKAIVTFSINRENNRIPTDSSIQILTAGLLGDNYIAITPMYSEEFMKEGGQFSDVQSAIILEKLIGKLIFKMTESNSQQKTNQPTGENR